MKRRDVLPLGAATILTLFSGCVSDSPLQAKAGFTYTPPNPVVGEKIVFDAGESSASEWEWFFDKSPGAINFDAKGTRVAHAFENSGAHIVTLRTTAPFGIIPGPNTDRATKAVYVEEQDASSAGASSPISKSTDRISLHLRGLNTNINMIETAVLQFSAANLDTEADLSIRLVLKIPNGMSVQGTSSVESGIGQYTATFDLPPGDTAGTSIQLAGTRTGRFQIEGLASYSFNDEDEQTRQGTIPIVVADA